ncbi:MAG: protein phosphatase [Pseudomonadota bacterium]
MGLSDYHIAELPCGAGWLGIASMPGRGGAYEADVNAVLRWGAGLVLTMTTASELARCGAARLGEDLMVADVAWRHLPIPDFGAPPPETDAMWPEVSALAHEFLAGGGRVFAHCYGGCGRSGMALLRLMVEAGEDVDPALERLRAVRPCAVEAEAQKAWAAIPMYERLGWSP